LADCNEIHVAWHAGDQGNSGLVVLNASFVTRDPMYGPAAVQEVSHLCRRARHRTDEKLFGAFLFLTLGGSIFRQPALVPSVEGL
jgi:hypothetical protein